MVIKFIDDFIIQLYMIVFCCEIFKLNQLQVNRIAFRGNAIRNSKKD